MPKVLLIISFICFAATGNSQEIKIVENSLIAKIAAKIHRQETYAITIGKTIFLNCRKKDFFSKMSWVKHEVTHLEQYDKYGTLRFLTLYLYHSVFHPKSVNPFELEAEIAQYASEPLTMISPQ